MASYFKDRYERIKIYQLVTSVKNSDILILSYMHEIDIGYKIRGKIETALKI